MTTYKGQHVKGAKSGKSRTASVGFFEQLKRKRALKKQGVKVKRSK